MPVLADVRGYRAKTARRCLSTDKHNFHPWKTGEKLGTELVENMFEWGKISIEVVKRRARNGITTKTTHFRESSNCINTPDAEKGESGSIEAMEMRDRQKSEGVR